MTAEIARIIVSRFLGEYFKNLDSETMSIGVSNNITNNKQLFSGYINCKDLEINAATFDKLNLPVKMSYGKIGTISMSLPIKSFLLGIYSPIEIRIEKIEIFLKTNDNWEFFDYTSFDYKSKLIKSITDNLIFKMQLKQNPDINNTYLNRTISYIVDNIMIDIKDITIIFEDIFSHKTKNIFCGINFT